MRDAYNKGFAGLKLALFSPDLGPVSRGKLLLVSAIHFFGIRDYGYLIKAGRIYHNYLSKEI